MVLFKNVAATRIHKYTSILWDLSVDAFSEADD